MRTLWLAALTAAGLTLLPGCQASPPPSSDRDAAASPAPSDPSVSALPVTATTLNWQACTDTALTDFQCASMTVPKSYADPAKGTFDIAVAKLPATGSAAQRLGSLFFNPGGPGVAAIELAPGVASALPTELRARFDFVVWDPRGVGKSSPLRDCTDGSYTLPATGPVDWSAVAADMRASERAANSACQQANAEIAPFISTNNTVTDLDALRQAVGEDKLTYWGTSYGTRIGYTYAARYPDHIRAMLLSSPVSPNSSWLDFATTAAQGPDDSIGLLFEADPNASAHYQRALAALERQPLTLPSGREFTRWHLQAWLDLQSTSDGNLPRTANFLAQADQAMNGKGTEQTKAAAAVDEVMEWSTTYPINGGAIATINCLDFEQRLGEQEQEAAMARNRARAPLTGWLSSMALFYCEGLDLTPDPLPTIADDWDIPMLVMASSRDGLTPYGFAVDLARLFHNSRLVTLIGGSHTPFLSAGSTCMNRIGTDYLLSGKLPAVDAACPAVM